MNANWRILSFSRDSWDAAAAKTSGKQKIVCLLCRKMTMQNDNSCSRVRDGPAPTRERLAEVNVCSQMEMQMALYPILDGEALAWKQFTGKLIEQRAWLSMYKFKITQWWEAAAEIARAISCCINTCSLCRWAQGLKNGLSTVTGDCLWNGYKIWPFREALNSFSLNPIVFPYS